MKLTIGIPTYNRANRIVETLDSIQCQIDSELSGKIEILIADNCSLDDTKTIIEQYRKNHALINVKYVRHKNNIGFDKNVDSLFHHATGDYVWTLADDDTLNSNALKKVVQSLENDSPNVVLVNFIAFDSNMERPQDIVPIQNDEVYKDPELFLKSAKSKYCLLSSLIFKKKSWLRIDTAPGIGSNYIHVYALFAILPGGTSKIISEPLVNYRQGNSSKRVNAEFLLNISLDVGYLILSMKTMGYKNNVVKWLLRESEDYIHRLVINLKLDGMRNKEEVRKKILTVYPTSKTILKILPIIYMPDAYFRKIYFLKKKISKKIKFKWRQ